MKALLFFIPLLLLACTHPCNITEQPIEIRGTSLSPLIAPGTNATLQHNYYACHEPQRGEIIAYNYTRDSVPIAKIVKAIPGDHWRIENNTIIVNNETLTNSEGIPYRPDMQGIKMLSLYAHDYPIIPKDTYLILGDNPQGSMDATKFGLVGKQDILGRIERK